MIFQLSFLGLLASLIDANQTFPIPSPSDFAANSANSAAIPRLVDYITASVQLNKSSNVGATYLSGIGSTQYISILNNFPVDRHSFMLRVGCVLLYGRHGHRLRRTGFQVSV